MTHKSIQISLIKVTVSGHESGSLPRVSLLEGSVHRVVNPARGAEAKFYNLPSGATDIVVTVDGYPTEIRTIDIPPTGELDICISMAQSGELYEYPDDAALVWASRYSFKGMVNDREYGSSIYSIKDGDHVCYGYNDAAEGVDLGGGNQEVEWTKALPQGATLAGVIHNHTAGGTDPNNFSRNPGRGNKPFDEEIMNDESKDYGRVDWYLAAPDGTLKAARASPGNRTIGLPIVVGLLNAEQAETYRKEKKQGNDPKVPTAAFRRTDFWQGSDEPPKKCVRKKVGKPKKNVVCVLRGHQ